MSRFSRLSRVVLVTVPIAVLLAPSGALAQPSQPPRALHAPRQQSGPENFLRQLVALTRRAAVKGKQIWNSKVAKAVRKANSARNKALKICDQWRDAYAYRYGPTWRIHWSLDSIIYRGSTSARAYDICKALRYRPLLT
jgi:hypothetical protein